MQEICLTYQNFAHQNHIKNDHICHCNDKHKISEAVCFNNIEFENIEIHVLLKNEIDKQVSYSNSKQQTSPLCFILQLELNGVIVEGKTYNTKRDHSKSIDEDSHKEKEENEKEEHDEI